jgi:hypothetical protein
MAHLAIHHDFASVALAAARRAFALIIEFAAARFFARISSGGSGALF